MAAPSRRDADGPATEFRGATVAEALAAARAVHGESVQVVRAQRVRRGMKGLLGAAGEVVLEVAAPAADASALDASALDGSAVGGSPVGGSAVGGSAVAASAGGPATAAVSRSGDPAQAVDDALRALMDRNDSLDVDPDPAPAPVARRIDLTAPRAALALPAQPLSRRVVEPPAEQAEVVEAVAEEPVEPEARPHPAPGIGAHRTAPLADPGWDPAGWHAAGVPLAVCRRLPETDPGDPRARMMALAAAIAAVVPAPCAPGPSQAVALSGYGPEGALALVQAGVSGVVPDRLYLQDGPVRATAQALAKGVLACVPR